MPRPAACLFDLDGLLLDTEPSHAEAWSQAAARFGLQLTAVQLQQLRGRRRLDCAHQVQAWIAEGRSIQVSSEHNSLSIGIACSFFEGDHVADIIDTNLVDPRSN